VAVKLEFLESGSPDCPPIPLYGFDIPSAFRLMALFGALADDSQQRIRLHDQSGVEAVQGCQLDLRVGTRDRGIKQTGPAIFDCVLTPEGWAEVAALTEPFCEARANSEHYQWLNEDGQGSLLLSPTGRW
jgi:hypothetical protein